MQSDSALKVAVAQIESVRGDLKTNLRKHLDVIDEARTAGVELLLFPELSLTGYNVGDETLRLARDRNDAIMAELAAAAGPMCAVFGLIEEGAAAQFYNAAAAVKDGVTAFLHRKINPPSYGSLEEGKHFAGGRYVDTFSLKRPWRASILICADLWNPALVYLSALHGSTILMAPISSAVESVGAEFDNPGGWDLNLRFYAMIYGFPVLMANRVGVEGDLTYWGGSRIVDPFGRVLAQAQDGTEQLVTADLDYDYVRRARYLLPTVRDSNLALVLREAERLEKIIGVPESVRTA